MNIGTSNIFPSVLCFYLDFSQLGVVSRSLLSFFFLFACCISVYDVVLTSPCHSLISLLLSFPEKSGADLYTQLLIVETRKELSFFAFDLIFGELATVIFDVEGSANGVYLD